MVIWLTGKQVYVVEKKLPAKLKLVFQYCAYNTVLFDNLKSYLNIAHAMVV